MARRLQVAPSVTDHEKEAPVERWRSDIDGTRRSDGRLCGSAWAVQGFASPLPEPVRRALDPPSALPRSAFIGAPPHSSELDMRISYRYVEVGLHNRIAL